jgi:hypothetical protein
MSKNKTAKTASKNNPTAREQGVKFKFMDQIIKPTMIIENNKSAMYAEFESSGELVLDSKGNPIKWQHARNKAVRV